MRQTTLLFLRFRYISLQFSKKAFFKTRFEIYSLATLRTRIIVPLQKAATFGNFFKGATFEHCTTVFFEEKQQPKEIWKSSSQQLSSSPSNNTRQFCENADFYCKKRAKSIVVSVATALLPFHFLGQRLLPSMAPLEKSPFLLFKKFSAVCVVDTKLFGWTWNKKELFCLKPKTIFFVIIMHDSTLRP